MSKKKLIAIITIIVLLFAAGISVGVFLYGRAETQATDGNQTTDQNQVSDGNQHIQGTLADGNTTTNPDATDENATTPDNEGAAGAEDNETVENDNQNANNNATNNNNVADNEENTGVTTDTNVDNVGETTISRVEEQERLISEDFLDWWQPMTVAVTPTEVGVELPQISVKKAAITEVGDANLVYIGQDITYVIAVTNNSETAVENIEVTDRIPENTTYVADSIEDAVILRKVDGELTSEVVGTKTAVEAENKILGVKWVVSIPAGETVIARFTVNVNKTMLNENEEEVETTGTILNTAIANGEESNEVQTSIIRTHKSSVITRLNEDTQEYEEVETAKIGDLITYTISIENTGDVEGTTYVIDNVPAGTAFISAQEGAKVTKSVDTSVIWSVTIPAHTTVTREFTVEVTSVDGLIKNVADVGGTPTNEDIINTANIDVIKTATAVNGEVITEDNPLEPVKVGDKIEYTIVVTNTGSRDLTNVLLKEQLEGVEVTKLVVDHVEKTIAKDAETGKLIIGDLKATKEATEEAEAVEAGVAVITAEYKVSYEKDIKNKGNEDGTTIPVYNKVIATGETVPNPENPNEVPEQVEDNDDETVPVAEDPRFEVVKTAVEVGKAGEDGTITFSDITGKVTPGDIVKYEIVVTNTGNTILTNIEVRDTLDVRVDEFNKDEDPITAGNIIKVIPSLVAGDYEAITTYYEVDQDDMIPEKINENDEVEIDIIENIVTVKPEDLDEKQDNEIVHVNPYTSRKVTKTWIGDEDNKYGTRPANITVRLYDDGVEVDAATITPNQEGNWSHKFTMKPKYNEDGTVIVYTITEDDVAYYAKNVPTTDMQEYTITNTLNQEKISVPVTKTWVDNDNRYNTRPSQITVRLWADEKEVQVATITADSVDQDGKWNYVFTNLPRYNGQGKEIVYKITEDSIADYDKEVVEYNITNTLNPEDKTSISGTKTWLDDGDKFNARPSQITVNLMIDGTVVNTQVVTPDENEDWKYSFTNLPTKDVNGEPITYSIQEDDVAYYTSEIIIPDQKNPNIINITNKLNQEYITLSGTKTWYAPSTVTIKPITVRVHQNGSDIPYKANVNGTEIEFKLELTPGEARNAGYSFGPLPKYSFTKKADGTIERTENRYEVREDKPTGFQDPVYSTITKTGNSWVQNITNKWAQEYLSINVNKVWHDLGNANSRPTIYIDLYKKVGNGAETRVNDKTLTFNNNKTSDSFSNLEKYTISPDGTTYTLNSYRVEERFSSDKYTSSGPSVTTPITSDTTVSFTNTLKQENTASITATKVWNIPTGATGATGIRIYVYQNGNRMDNQYVDLTYGGKTSHTFTGLPKYNFKADGTVELYNYTVQEAVNEQYITTQSGNTITNTAKGVVETITTEITTTSTSSPVDVVFVLDVSNSMKDEDRITKMRDAVNSAMSTIKNYNSSNRVGIVTFTSDNVRVKAKSIQGLTSDKNQKVAYDPNYYENGTKKGVFYICRCSHTNVNSCTCDKSGGLTVMGATYTQTGIELGAEMLIDDNSIDKTGRTPIMILVTDGEPTVYNTNYASNLTTLDSTGRAQGQEGDSANSSCTKTNTNCVYYTVRSAIYWKSQIAAKYNGLANIFTLGIGLDGSEAALATLNPTYANIKAYSNTLKNKFVNGGLDIVNNTNIANYADEAYLTDDEITTAQLIAKLNSFINNSNKFKETSTKRMMTTSEITSKVVTLTNVDTSKPFTITCANGSYTLETAKTAGVANQNGTTVTVYLDKTGLTSQVNIKYYKK